jgi:hypothetical protein
MLEASTWLNEACLLIVMMVLHALFSLKRFGTPFNENIRTQV